MKKYPLLPSQLGVFLECLAYPGTTQYNLPHCAELESYADVDVLKKTWEKLFRASETLCTRFELDMEGNPLQWPDEDMVIDIPVVHTPFCSHWKDGQHKILQTLDTQGLTGFFCL